jgi:anti-sigma regulatory factor (Ser/Thr protein kinase)
MEHDLFVYREDHELGGRIGAFLQEGIEEGSKTIMVVDDRKAELLRDMLGPEAAQVQLIDCAAHYARPEAALADYDSTLRHLVRDGVKSVRLFGELPRCETQADYDRWISYEAILNRAMAHHPVWIMCGYDDRVVPASVVERMRCTHSRVLTETLNDSPGYLEPAGIVDALTPDPRPVGQLEQLTLEGGGAALRRQLRGRMSAAGVSDADCGEMLVAADEVLVNAERHGGGTRQVRSGTVDGQFVLEISDRGAGFDDALAGYLPPVAGKQGAGLWVARQLTRRLELLRSADGLTVRLWI